ncbi:hypothetical protein ACI79C_08355 [Geodermatophilus sp. SYSU D00697]
MAESPQPPSRPGPPAPRSPDPLPSPSDAHDGATVPLPVPGPEDAGAAPTAADTGPGPTILGFPAEPPEDMAAEPPEDMAAEPLPVGAGPGLARSADSGTGGVAVAERPPPAATGPRAGAPDVTRGLVALRRADRVGAAALLLAGLAAGLGLWLPWGRGAGTAGLVPVLEAFGTLGTGSGELPGSDVWAPLVVVAGGAVLFLLGLSLLRRARTHRLVGLLALVVAEAVAVGVVVVLSGAGWSPARLGPGAWCAVAVAVLGLLGALKALLTTPAVAVEPR